jgi:hypothetical protein
MTSDLFPATAPNTALAYVAACRRRVIESALAGDDPLLVTMLLVRLPDVGVDAWWDALRGELAEVERARAAGCPQWLNWAVQNAVYLLAEVGLRPNPDTLLAEMDEPRRADR